MATEQLAKPSKSAQKVLLFLPEGEIHEIALLYVDYMLQKAGIKTIYLGPNSPIDQVEFVVNSLAPKYLYTHLTSVSRSFDIREYVNTLGSKFPENNILISGAMTNSEMHVQHDNIQVLSSLVQVKHIISSI